MQYDWRGRLVTADNGPQILYYVYDNLDNRTEESIYDGNNSSPGPVTNGLPQQPSQSAELRAKTEIKYDSLGRIYETVAHGVDQKTGQVAGSLRTKTWYDVRGNAVAISIPGGAWNNSKYDGAGRVTVRRRWA